MSTKIQVFVLLSNQGWSTLCSSFPKALKSWQNLVSKLKFVWWRSTRNQQSFFGQRNRAVDCLNSLRLWGATSDPLVPNCTASALSYLPLFVGGLPIIQPNFGWKSPQIGWVFQGEARSWKEKLPILLQFNRYLGFLAFLFVHQLFFGLFIHFQKLYPLHLRVYQ